MLRLINTAGTSRETAIEFYRNKNIVFLVCIIMTNAAAHTTVMSRLMTKPTKWHVRPVWSESSLSAWRKLRSLATHWAHSEDSDQTGRMPRLIWVFAGRTVISLVLSWGGCYHFVTKSILHVLFSNGSDSFKCQWQIDHHCPVQFQRSPSWSLEFVCWSLLPTCTYCRYCWLDKETISTGWKERYDVL